VSPTRRQVIAGAAAGALGAVGLYELVDQLSSSPPARPAPAARELPEQHLLQGVKVVTQNDVEVLVPPLHHEVMTAQVTSDVAGLRDAQSTLEDLLAGLDRDYVPPPAGLGVTLAWGIPYFERLVPAAAKAHMPLDKRAGKPAVGAARRFPSDPTDTVLEGNDVAILLRSDVRDHILDAERRLCD